MKVVSSEGLTKLITLIKNNFIKTTDVEAVSELEVDSAPTSASSHLITSGGVYTAIQGGMTEETWTFTLSDQSTVTKKVKVGT